MAKNPLPSSINHLNDEEYIDIEVNSASQNREFEFQMASITNNNTTSPADELFYRGRLLPLHQKILQTQLFEDLEDSFCVEVSTERPFGSGKRIKSSAINFTISSPSQSFEVSPNDHKISPKKVWIKFIKHSLITQKLKSLFSKSSCRNGNCCSSKDMNVSNKIIPLKSSNNIGSVSSRSFKWQQKSRNGISSRSFSSTNFSSRSSFDCSFNSNYELNFSKRSSFTSESEGSIEDAVAHCKKSHTG
ncbi:hypothetical protein EJD97_005136 [Solanum chilense]|uniref:Membrane-associated kinase regulator 4 n=1 Tax=Solanum chilense TaxID=4083 RepID=A0A6N2AJL0_SOLCI|nr:hypothetical protein EJD97_005136 [Solanum chilense]